MPLAKPLVFDGGPKHPSFLKTCLIVMFFLKFYRLITGLASLVVTRLSTVVLNLI